MIDEVLLELAAVVLALAMFLLAGAFLVTGAALVWYVALMVVGILA